MTIDATFQEVDEVLTADFGGDRALVDQAYNSGWENGYNDGYKRGEVDGETKGYNYGWNGGYANGKVDGEREGREKGYAEGYNKGLEDGGADLTELLTLQESYIYGGVNDVLHTVGFEQTAEGDYITGLIPCDFTTDIEIYTKNIEFADDTEILYVFEDVGNYGYWMDNSEIEITDWGAGVKSIFPLTQSNLNTHIRLRFKSYRFIPIVTINEPIGGESV